MEMSGVEEIAGGIEKIKVLGTRSLLVAVVLQDRNCTGRKGGARDELEPSSPSHKHNIQ